MVKDLIHLASNPHMVQHCLSCRADREKGILQGKLRCAQKAINEGTHAHHHPASTETAAASKEGTTTAAAMEQHQLKTRIFELENEVHTCIEMSSLPSFALRPRPPFWRLASCAGQVLEMRLVVASIWFLCDAM